MEAKVNLPVLVEKYAFNHKKLKLQWMKAVRRIRKLSSNANTTTYCNIILFQIRKATYVLKKALSKIN